MNEQIIRRTLGEAVKGDRTDWDRLRSITDDELEAAIAADPDASLGRDHERPPLQTLVFRDLHGQWRWRLVGADGHAMADSPQGYTDRGDVDEALDELREIVAATVTKAA